MRMLPIFPATHAGGTARSSLALLAVLAVLLAACTPKPTPYQPLGKKGGYEETRLKENVYRISFRGNRYTRETAVIDYLYLRSAELTRDAGFSHFVIVQDYGKTQGAVAPRSGFSIGLGFSSGIRRRSAFGVGGHLPFSPGYGTVVDYHLGVLVIRMMNAEEAKEEKDVLDVDFLLKSIHEKFAKKPAK